MSEQLQHVYTQSNLFCYTAEADAANKPNKRQKKEAVSIDFTTPLEKDFKELTKEMFAPVTKGVGINLPGTGTAVGKRGKKKKEKRDDHRLPDDMHFTSRQLLTLFLKPKFFVSYPYLVDFYY